jgi:tripartite-type tricarboxylate transporter receptor subunit TctC
MRRTVLKTLLAAPAALVLALASSVVLAQAPSKPVRLVVPAPAGDGSDVLARAIAQEMSAGLGQPVLIENRPGAGGSIASDMVAKAAPDGHTLILGNGSSHGVTPSLYPRLPYDTLKDFAPITLVATAPNVLVVSASLPVGNVREFIAHAKARPGQLHIASGGNGSLSHLSAELFKSMAGVDLVHVPYKGAAPGLTDLAAGQVAAMIINIPSAQGLLEVPTLDESGLKGYETTSWFALLAPARTPAAAIDRLQGETAKALATPAVRERLATMGLTPVGNTPAQFDAFMRAEIAKYAKVIKDAGVKID